MTPPLPPDFLTRPLAHRALHDLALGRPENSRAAVAATIEGGFGVEIDLQLSADGQAMVFHDYDLRRLTGATGPLRQRTAEELARIGLTGGNEGIPTLPEILAQIGGRVPVLVEIKDQDGAMGPAVGPLEQAVAAAAAGYSGPIAVMSFNPHSVAAMRRFAPNVPRGLTTSAFTQEDWPTLPAAVRDRLHPIPDDALEGCAFISHDAADLARPRVAELKAAGLAVLCWTVRSAAEEATARKFADNITFEGYRPA